MDRTDIYVYQVLFLVIPSEVRSHICYATEKMCTIYVLEPLASILIVTHSKRLSQTFSLKWGEAPSLEGVNTRLCFVLN